MTELKDKTVIVTGAAGGIGRAIAQEAGRAGARLALVDADALVHGCISQSLVSSLGCKVRSPRLLLCQLLK